MIDSICASICAGTFLKTKTTYNKWKIMKQTQMSQLT